MQAAFVQATLVIDSAYSQLATLKINLYLNNAPKTMLEKLIVKFLKSFCLIGFLLSLSSSVTAAVTAVPLFKANYQADIKGFRVKASRELQNKANGQQALIFKATSMIASLEESTLFSWEDNRIKPLKYDYLQNVIGKKEDRHIDFDHNQKRISAHYRGSEISIPYSPLLLDTLSYQLQLQQDLLKGEEELSYSIIRRDKTKLNHFKRELEETVNTELGKLRTIKVSLAHDTDKRETYIWFAVDWDYMLVRFEQYEKGKKEFVINLIDATIGGKRITGL